MEYDYYGAEFNSAQAKSTDYPGIDTPRDLYAALTGVWCAETCSPNIRPRWSKENMTDGQCSITALLVQEIFGGEVYGMRLLNAVHCYNELDGHIIDLTSGQFGEKVRKLHYDKSIAIDRAQQLADPAKLQRYELLRARLKERLTGRP